MDMYCSQRMFYRPIRVLVLLLVFVNTANGFKRYRSCADYLTDHTSDQLSEKEYIIFLNNGVGVSLFCTGFSTGSPKGYLILRAGSTENYASFYENVGVPTGGCGDTYPRELYGDRGRTNYGKIRIDTSNLRVDISDDRYGNTSNVVGASRHIQYATAGDKLASSQVCIPLGAFKIDLTGTPFAVSHDTVWTWTGNFSSGGSAGGHAWITNDTYLGCWRDRTDRLLPAGRQDSDHGQTVPTCVDHCRSLGFSYAGLQYGVECHCGNDYQRYGRVTDRECNKPCSGDPNTTCGGVWRASIYKTAIAQAISGKCGGYPGRCFPATSSNPTVPSLQLQIVPGHICLTANPCLNEGACVAIDHIDYTCQCYTGYSGKNCGTVAETRVNNGEKCPTGFQPETCMCFEQSSCGAKFEGDNCVTTTGHSQVVCRPGNPGHVILFNVDGTPTARCPDGSTIVGCAYWSTQQWRDTKGQGEVDRFSVCRACHRCAVQARCKQYVCGCQNGGRCNNITGQCECPPQYFGDKCETFDYCSYYERSQNRSACAPGGICQAVSKPVVTTTGGDNVRGTCTFPFQYKGFTYNSCVNDNTVGPPFACAGQFDRLSRSYINLGRWSPGPSYTMAAWVKTDLIDTIRRTVVGGVSNCNDFGFNLNSGTFRGFLKLSTECTRDLDAGRPLVKVGRWYMVAVTCNGTHALIFQDGQFRESNTVLMNHLPTTAGLRIGGEACCPSDYFHGMIKTVKIWNRYMTNDDINRSMYNIGTENSTVEALHDGLVGHWELGGGTLRPCLGNDHGGEDWTITDGSRISGVHCNISLFVVPVGVTLIVTPYDGTHRGKLDITALEIRVDGYIDGVGAGYRGGPSSPNPGHGGQQGETYLGNGSTSITANKGGGGGGIGGSTMTDGTGRSGGGGGYGTAGSPGVKSVGDRTGLGAGGVVYGDASINHLYIGSGGGSGGNAHDLTTNPKGGKGGNGGGAVVLTAERSVIVNGVISVAGQKGQGDVSSSAGCMECPDSCDLKSPVRCLGNSTTACWDMSGPGGGGSGGSIYLSAKRINVGYQKLWAMGGEGGTGGSHCCGGAGGMGRIKIDSVILTGVVGDVHGVLKTSKMTDTFIDYSQGGQKLINYQHTVYGNEVYRGCFRETDTRTTKLGVLTSNTNSDNMTPKVCQHTCRSRGFMFSGTENGSRCYCDNHLDISNKAPDSDCNVACKGDPLQVCGGPATVQIFGPPPAAPAQGHNVVPRCNSWCVTGDSSSDNPKWGVCSKDRPSVTDWDIKCVCPAGKTGFNCNQLCPQGTYGLDCGRNCTCNSTNTAICSPSNGECQCKPGFQGNTCDDVCSHGRFGQNCASLCNCSHNSQCDARTGVCSCQPGWMGPECNFPCPRNKYGPGCNQTCNCFHGSCDPVGGTCDCHPGYKLPTCYERCDRKEYGKNCETRCDCNQQACDAVTGLCQCGPGYLGHRCSILCPSGYHGQGCTQQCHCKNGFGCDHVTGNCQCGSGFIGDRCEDLCSSYTYGSQCRGACTCHANQTMLCNAINGACDCSDGYRGFNCELPCQPGYYGRNCIHLCTCLHGTCNQRGQCQCGPGFMGPRCQTQCNITRYGPGCGQTCPPCNNGVCNKVDGSCICQAGRSCVCPQYLWGPSCQNACSCMHGVCNHRTGACTCAAGWVGTNCDQPCPTGRYGQGCASVCSCRHGKCDPVTGHCDCDAGFSGTLCDTSCQNGTYGASCRFRCAPCGPYSYPGCDKDTGACLCSVGYTGPFCDRPCPLGTHGNNCSQTCSCLNNGLCNSVTGACMCGAGYTGANCESKCSSGHWGLNCSHPCDCGPYSTGCNFHEGICICKPGFVGVKCRESCDVGYYGNLCRSTCQCDTRTSRCSPVDGSCLCEPGYSGTMCDSVCRAGWWGRGCSQACLCNGRGSCSPFSGHCDCDTGYRGGRCEQQCDQDVYWGKSCANLCKCNGAHCDPRDGTCRCPPGKIGHHCEQTCDSNHFGFQCAQLCGCQNGGVCAPVTGACTCQPGWAGQFCTESCPVGYYGLGCSQVCPDCENGGTCDSFSGVCFCAPGYTGQYCNTSISTVTSKLTYTRKLVPSSGVHFSVGQLVGLIIGMLVFTVIVAMVAMFVTRRHYYGRFGNETGAVKFKGEEVEFTTKKQTKDTTTGFSNPILEMPGFTESNTHNIDAAAGSSDLGTASNYSDDEGPTYFKDSAA